MTTIDLLFNFVVFGVGLATGMTAYWEAWHVFRWGGFALLIFIADIILLVGIGMHNGCLVAFWQAVKIINIVFLFIGWVAIPMMITPRILHVADQYSQEFVTEYIFWGGVMLTLLILPFYYIYYWVVVNSYRKDIMSPRDQFTPVVGGIGHVFVVNNQKPHGLYRQPPPPYQPAYGQPMQPAYSQPPPPIRLYGVEGTNQVIYPGGTESV